MSVLLNIRVLIASDLREERPRRVQPMWIYTQGPEQLIHVQCNVLTNLDVRDVQLLDNALHTVDVSAGRCAEGEDAVPGVHGV